MRITPKPNIRSRTLPALLAAASLCAALGLAPFAPAVAAVGDFQLPPGGTTAPQGPVAPGEAPPRSTATPSPAPTAAPALTPAPRPAASTPAPAPSARPSPAPTPSARPTPGATPAPSASVAPEASPSPTPEASLPPALLPAPSAAATAAPPALQAETLQPSDSGLPWGWIGAVAALLAVLAAGAWLWLRRTAEAEVRAPEIQRPDLGAAATQRPAPPPASPAGEEEEDQAPLTLALEARELAISLTAATLSYRVTLTNMSGSMLEDVTVMGDMISAHASLTEEEQLTLSESELVAQHVIERMRPGETMQVSGEFRLNFPMIRPIRKGDALLFVPLARLKVLSATSGELSVVRTVLVGQRSPRPGAGLQPFRLDLGPRIYREVTQKIF